MLKKIEIAIRKLTFYLLLLLSRRKRKSTPPDFAEVRSVAFIRLNRIGDAIVTTPLYHILKEKYNFRITVIADRKNHFVFNNNPFIDNIFVFRKGLAGLKEAVKELNKHDIIVDLHDDVSTTVSYLIALSSVPYKFALRKENYKLFSHTVERLDPVTIHVTDRMLAILDLFAINKPAEINTEFYPGTEALSAADNFVKSINPENKFLTGISISAGNEARFWEVERFQKLMDEVKQKFPDFKLIILTAPSDLEKAEKISNGNYPVFQSKNFSEFAAVISKLDLLFTPDTSTVHLAASWKIPMFGLYVKYNTDHIIWYPYNTIYEAIVTTDPDLKKLGTEQVIPDFIKFARKIHDGK